MIRTSLIKTTQPGLRRLILVAPTLGALATPRGAFLLSGTQRSSSAHARQLSSSSGRCNVPESRTSKKTHQEATESHKQELPGSSSPEISQLTKYDAVSTVPPPDMVRGDWVLFHPVYSQDELRAVEVLHREAKTISDKVAYGLVKLARTLFDWVSGYKHIEKPPAPGMTIEELRKAGYLLSEKQWLERILFLESIAGVPGMVAATLRHLTSLRLMRRDSGWIHTCLEEAENERMHLMTFMTLRQPSMLLRLLVLGAQGVFYNVFFLSYMFSPKICHRFVGYLEEEAVLTYTRCIADLEAGKIPEWTNLPAPEISIDYWRLHPDAKLLDVIYAVRSDETTHRFVNHSLANLNPVTDVNPFALREPDMHVKGTRIEFERLESEQYVRQSHEIMQQHTQQGKALTKDT